MQGDAANAGRLCAFDQCVNVVLMAVHATIGQQAHQVQGAALLLGGRDRLRQHRVGGQRAGLDVAIDAADVLLHDAAGADIEVADFGVAELAGGQADIVLGGVQRTVGIARFQRVPVRGVCCQNGIIVAFEAVTETVKDE